MGSRQARERALAATEVAASTRGQWIACLNPISPLYALAHLGLGRAWALAGDLAKAPRAYQDFLALWRDADVDLPIVQQAKAEYAKLN